MDRTVSFHFNLFGTPRLTINDDPCPMPPQPATFCAFLILNRQRRITREEVQVAFWPDAEPARAQERLRRTLYLLRRALEPHTGFVEAEGSELLIAPHTHLWVDYESFEQALSNAHRQDPPLRPALEQAIALYTDDLLKDVYTDWALVEREHALQRFLTALRHLINICQAAGDWDTVLRHAHRLLEHDPFQEDAHRALMTAYAAQGDRSAALRQYQFCVQVLDDELGVEPLPETTELYAAIREGHGVAPVKTPLPVAPAPPTSTTDLEQLPLVGRDQELREIAAEWRICQNGNSRLVLVTGPAGIGKTRLLAEAGRQIPGADATVLTGNCYAMEAGTPYQLITDLLHSASDLIEGDLPASTRADLAQLVPALAPAQGSTATPTTTAVSTSVRLQEAVTDAFRLLAGRGDGLWLIAEDLHWADPASLACLNHALRRINDLPLLVLASLRDEEVSYDSPLLDWPRNAVHAPAPTTHIQIAPLPASELARLVEQTIAGHAPELAPLLYEETAGNPFFIVETLRALIEQDVLVQSDSGWTLREGGLPQTSDVPVSEVVLQVIQGRIRRLTRAAQEVLTVGAVLEHDIEERLLEALVDPAIALDLALDELLRAAILQEKTPGVYQFAHIKVREIVYADTSAPRRRFLHRRAAGQLVRLNQVERLADIARLAYHYQQAHDWPQAVIFGWRASQTASAAGALTEANRYAEIASQILDAHADVLDQAETPAPLPAIRYDLLAVRAEFSRRAATAGLFYPPDLLGAIEDLTPHLDKPRQARAALQQATHALGQGQLSRARDLAQHGRRLFAAQRDQRGELDAMQQQFEIAYRAGDMGQLRTLLADMQTLSENSPQHALQQTLAYNEMRLARYRGNWSRVLTLAEEQATLSADQVDPAIAWVSQVNLGLAYMRLGMLDRATDIARQALAASEEANVIGLGARILQARLALRQGQPSQAQAALFALLDDPNPLIGDSELVAPALVLVRAYASTGDSTAALDWARRAARAVARIRLPLLYPLAQVGMALAYLTDNDPAAAQKRLAYPLDYMLLEDTSPQEIYMLRAAAARQLDDHATAQRWLDAAARALSEQAGQLSDTQLRESFLTRVSLHRLIRTAHTLADWTPADVLHSYP